MKVVVQRSKKSKVTIDNKVNGSINKGYVLLVGFTHGDTTDIVDKMINKILNLRKDKFMAKLTLTIDTIMYHGLEQYIESKYNTP